MTGASGIRIQFVSHFELNAKYESMVAHYCNAGLQLVSRYKHNRLAHPDVGQPIGTRSIMERVIDPDTNHDVPLAHFYLLPDDVTIGASGKDDPKRVAFEGVDYRTRSRSRTPNG